MRVGGREVVGGGSVVTQENDDTIELSHANLNIKIIFKADGGAVTVDSTLVNNDITFTVKNSEKNPFATFDGQIGSIEGPPPKKIFFAVFVLTVAAERVTRFVSYTFSEEVG